MAVFEYIWGQIRTIMKICCPMVMGRHRQVAHSLLPCDEACFDALQAPSMALLHSCAVKSGCWLLAGVGNDPRNRHFNTVSQGEKYDPEAHLISAWVPVLAPLPVEARHRPWESSDPETLECPPPIVDATTQINRRKA